MRSKLLNLLILIFIALVFYFSWLPNPHIGTYGFLPARLAYWTDADDNMNLRTAVPLVFLGLFSGMWLVSRKYTGPQWAVTWLGLIVIVALAEIGQLALPKRHFDWGDIVWGAAGALGGMAVVWMVNRWINQSFK
ncbi:hypothetical protein ACFPMF_24630 [Larkinella bovis]|uniref:VanZ family protein n=1 Tax=Larkinella bovis TaxID=683041 RepID=A0ABW0II33_9BACT